MYHSSIKIRLMLDGKLNEYLHKIDKECHERIEQFVEQMKAGRQLQKLLRILIAENVELYGMA